MEELGSLLLRNFKATHWERPPIWRKDLQEFNVNQHKIRTVEKLPSSDEDIQWARLVGAGKGANLPEEVILESGWCGERSITSVWRLSKILAAKCLKI